jgi:hypothetical protein
MTLNFVFWTGRNFIMCKPVQIPYLEVLFGEKQPRLSKQVLFLLFLFIYLIM